MAEWEINILNRHTITNSDGTHGHHTASAEPAHGARGNEAADGLRERTPGRSAREYGHRDEVERPAPDRVRQAADERLRRRRRQQEGRREPGRHCDNRQRDLPFRASEGA